MFTSSIIPVVTKSKCGYLRRESTENINYDIQIDFKIEVSITYKENHGNITFYSSWCACVCVFIRVDACMHVHVGHEVKCTSFIKNVEA